MRRVLELSGLVLLLGGCVFALIEFLASKRGIAVLEGRQRPSYRDVEQVKKLSRYDAHPRVTQAFSRWVEHSASEFTPEDKIAVAADRAFRERRPEPTDSFLRGATLLFAKYSDRGIKVPAWFSSWDDPRITAALQDHLIAFGGPVSRPAPPPPRLRRRTTSPARTARCSAGTRRPMRSVPSAGSGAR